MTFATTRKVKNNGQVFTPAFLVHIMLDYVGYTSDVPFEKHIIDNSCGDGAFLREVVERFCTCYLEKGYSKAQLKCALETYVHGIELDSEAYALCKMGLDDIALRYGLKEVRWDLLNTDALQVSAYNGRMDFVVGNPPYVRVHNLADSYEAVKTFHFAQDGMTDLYLVFYELGFRMLNKVGKLCYITPSSWLSSLAATNMRRYIFQMRQLNGLIDLGHFQAFEGATTYTMITRFDMQNQSETIAYAELNAESKVCEHVDDIHWEAMHIGQNFYVARNADLVMLKSIKQGSLHRYVQVKNGFATLADQVFIKNVDFSPLTIPVLKASTGKWTIGFFPYNNQGKPLSKEEIFAYPEVENYLNTHKADLLKGKSEEDCPDWYLYGRTQALKDVFTDKYAINTIIKDVESVKLTPVSAGSGLYSGLYILTTLPYDQLKRFLQHKDFIHYLKMLKNYKSGGYYTYSSKDLEQYLHYKISHDATSKTYIPTYERGLFDSY